MENKTMGAMIANRRKELGMTQKELADQLGITDKAVSKWERDLACPDIQTIPKLAELLNVSLEELMSGVAPQEEPVREINFTIRISMRAVAIAMGVAVTVLAILDKLSMKTGFILLGIGLACAGISMLEDKDETWEEE